MRSVLVSPEAHHSLSCRHIVEKCQDGVVTSAHNVAWSVKSPYFAFAIIVGLLRWNKILSSGPRILSLSPVFFLAKVVRSIRSAIPYFVFCEGCEIHITLHGNKGIIELVERKDTSSWAVIILIITAYWPETEDIHNIRHIVTTSWEYQLMAKQAGTRRDLPRK